ncbi:MAG TPA: SOS response-associated peptidase [Rhodanobacteraceae bacterium]|nr:SOS response-associated peptidase [Rhodanobacteraceae bacterium]
MCGRYAEFGPVTVERGARQALHALDQGLDLEMALNAREPQYNIAPTDRAPVLARQRDGSLTVDALRWGLVPAWAKDVKIGVRAINARAESARDKPMFRAAFRARRALVPASGYYEWRSENGVKQPYFIHAPDDSLLMFAGLWDLWKPRDDPAAEWLRSFTVLTGAPGRVSGDIHDRQPMVLPPATWATWLDGSADDADALLTDVPEAELAFHAVSRAVGSPRNEGPELVQPI